MIISVVIPDELAELIKSLEYGSTDQDGYTEILRDNLSPQDINNLTDYGILTELFHESGEYKIYITGLGSLFKDRI